MIILILIPSKSLLFALLLGTTNHAILKMLETIRPSVNRAPSSVLLQGRFVVVWFRFDVIFWRGKRSGTNPRCGRWIKMWQVYYMVRAGRWLVILQSPRGLTLWKFWYYQLLTSSPGLGLWKRKFTQKTLNELKSCFLVWKTSWHFFGGVWG